jgi:DnaD/phage-associated family protein
MTQDLIDYLVQYSVEGGHKSVRYMEEIARSWKEQGIATPKQAAAATRKYNKSVYSIMKQLGKNTDPAPKELSFIDSWVKDMAMPLNVILEACDRTVMNTEKRRFEYADSILRNWKEQGIETLNDVKALDNSRYTAGPAAESAPKKEVRSSQANNQFNRFAKGNVNYGELLEKIKVN